MDLLLTSVCQIGLGGILAVIFCGTKKNRINAIFLFSMSLAIKLAFLNTWIYYKTSSFDYSYLQFPDEFKYLSFDLENSSGTLRNLYFYIVWLLQEVGFNIFNIKLLNIVISSLAIVRLYSLVDYVKSRKVFRNWIFLYFVIFFPAGVYFSIFVLREAIIMFAVVELVVRLVRTKVFPFRKGLLPLVVFLAMLRTPFILFASLFVYGRHLELSRLRLVIAVIVVLPFLPLIYNTIQYYTKVGSYYQLQGGEKSGTTNSEVRITTGSYISLIKENVFGGIVPDGGSDLIHLAIFLHFYLPLLYMLTKTPLRREFWRMWPLWMPFLVAVIGGICTFMNVRYFAVVAPFIVFPLALVHAKLAAEGCNRCSALYS